MWKYYNYVIPTLPYFGGLLLLFFNINNKLELCRLELRLYNAQAFGLADLSDPVQN